MIALRGLCLFVPLLFFLGLPGCSRAPLKPEPGFGTLWGTVEMVPHPEVAPRSGGGGSYGSRRLRDVQVVDYSKPGFAVVSIDGRPSSIGAARVQIRSVRSGAVLSPERSVVGSGGQIIITNETASSQVISCPEGGWIREIESKASVEVFTEVNSSRGAVVERTIHLLGASEEWASVVVCPGPFTIASSSGDWSLRDLSPGPGRIHVWHPRFPSIVKDVRVLPDRALRLDLRIGAATTRAESRINEVHAME